MDKRHNTNEELIEEMAAAGVNRIGATVGVSIMQGLEFGTGL